MTHVEIEADQVQFGSMRDQLLVAPDRAREEPRRFDLDRRSIRHATRCFIWPPGDAVRCVSRSRLPTRPVIAVWRHRVAGHGIAAL
jgi:hypothetical protein